MQFRGLVIGINQRVLLQGMTTGIHKFFYMGGGLFHKSLPLLVNVAEALKTMLS